METGLTYQAQGFVQFGYEPNLTYYGSQVSFRRNIEQTSQHGDFKHETPYTFLVDERVCYVGVRRITNYAYPGTPDYVQFGCQTGSFPDSLFSYGPSNNDAYTACLDKFFAIIRGKLDLSIDIAEFSQTKRMLTTLDNFSNFRHLFKALKNANFSFVKPSMFGKTEFSRLVGRDGRLTDLGQKYYDDLLRQLRKEGDVLKYTTLTASDAWLVWQYGVRPLMSDIHETVELLTETLVPGKVFVSAQVSLPYPSVIFRDANMSSGSGATIKEKVQFSAKSKVGCRISATIAKQEDLPQLARFTSLNPASIIWEATTLSFVVDWWVEIGNYLRILENLYTYRMHLTEISVRTLNALDARIGVNETIDSGYGDTISNKFASHVKQVQFDRSIGSLPTPLKPRVRTDLGATRVLSAAALIAQYLLGPKKI